MKRYIKVIFHPDHEKLLIKMRFIALSLILSSTLLLWPGGTGRTSAGETLELFEEAWSDFDRNYSYFSYKAIDWNQVKQEYQARFSTEMPSDEFARNLNDMLQVLHDWHVWVELPDSSYLGYSSSYTVNYPSTPFTGYAKKGRYETLGNNVVLHAIVDQNIAHIIVNTLSSSSFGSISDEDIKNLFISYADTDGMIIDIRPNNGGSEDIASKFASHFTDRSLVYGYVKYRNEGADHDDFGELITKSLQPNSDLHYDKPVVCLIGKRCMSSAEWFTLMMRACPGVTLMGDTTKGASGNPKTFQLSNGVNFSVSSWVAYTDKMVEIEDRGIKPEIEISPENSFDSSHDYILEKAIALIKNGDIPTDPQGEIAIKATPDSGGVPLSVSLACTGINDAAEFLWDFGDGSEETTTTTSTTVHTYYKEGFYLAFVTALDDDGGIIDMASAEITCTSGGAAECVTLNADFSLNFPYLKYDNFSFGITFNYGGDIYFVPDWSSLTDADTSSSMIELNPDLSFDACVNVAGAKFELSLIPDAAFSKWRIELK